PSPRRTPSICATLEERRALWRQLEENDEATLERPCELLEHKPKVKVSFTTMSRAGRKLGWTSKKSLAPSERDEQARAETHENFEHCG
ncbi:MAG TPA: hypothetical protein VGW38_25855, partial [Chloroflexota bacterium]|nr:hypothetical protein [Chloroflexota bacterium]